MREDGRAWEPCRRQDLNSPPPGLSVLFSQLYSPVLQPQKQVKVELSGSFLVLVGAENLSVLPGFAAEGPDGRKTSCHDRDVTP